MCQHTSVTNSQFTVFIPFHPKFHSLAVFNFEGNMVGMAMMVVPVAVMVVCLSSHIYDGRGNRQYGRILILNELADILCDDIEEQDKPNNNEYLQILFSVNCKFKLDTQR